MTDQDIAEAIEQEADEFIEFMEKMTRLEIPEDQRRHMYNLHMWTKEYPNEPRPPLYTSAGGDR